MIQVTVIYCFKHNSSSLRLPKLFRLGRGVVWGPTLSLSDVVLDLPN